MEPSLSNKVAVVGIGETRYYKRGASPDSEFVLALRAIQAAADDAGVDVREIDGFASYSNDRNDPVRVARALGIKEFGFANMFWTGGGGGVCGAVGNAGAGLIAGFAKYVVVYRALAQGQFSRFGQGRAANVATGEGAFVSPYGLMSPAQFIALRTTRFMEQYGVTQDALAGLAMASYAHAQTNPRAVMYGRPLSREDYDNSRWVVEPFHLFDCCQENDGAAALILTTTEHARDLQQKPVRLLAATQGSDDGYGLVTHNERDFASSNFKGVARRLYEMAGLGPKDVDVAQIYENFTGGTLMALVEHGFCSPEESDEFCTVENLTVPNGRLPINTSGGNLAECYMHGLGLVNEAVRQIRGTSTSQVPDARVSLVAGGPATAAVSSLIFTD